MVAACSSFDSDPTAPSEEPFLTSQEKWPSYDRDPSPSGFFPLDVGNEWVYDGQLTLRFEGDSLIYATLLGERRQIIGTDEFLGRVYTVERQTQWNRLFPFPPSDSSVQLIRYRQDRAGLYEFDGPQFGVASVRRTEWLRLRGQVEAAVSSNKREAYARLLDRVDRKMRIVDAALQASATRTPRRIGPPGGAQTDELTRLKYPLHPGQRWAIRDDTLFDLSCFVESHDVFDLPAGRMNGYRIRIESSVFGPEDRLEVWYGRDGFLGLRAHFETLYTSYQDPYGQDSLFQITEQYITLESLKLVPRGQRTPGSESP